MLALNPSPTRILLLWKINFTMSDEEVTTSSKYNISTESIYVPQDRDLFTINIIKISILSVIKGKSYISLVLGVIYFHHLCSFHCELQMESIGHLL